MAKLERIQKRGISDAERAEIEANKRALLSSDATPPAVRIEPPKPEPAGDGRLPGLYSRARPAAGRLPAQPSPGVSGLFSAGAPLSRHHPSHSLSSRYTSHPGAAFLAFS